MPDAGVRRLDDIAAAYHEIEDDREAAVQHWLVLRWCGWVIGGAWILWIVVWAIASVNTKAVIRRETIGSRAAYLLPIMASIVLLLLARKSHLGGAITAAGPPLSWLYLRFIPFYAGVVWVGTPLVLGGILIAFWARFHLAGNWSGTVTVKQDHALILTGPYRFVRHPIYTGLLLAVAGTACAFGQVRGIVALALTFFGFWYKSRLEERFMVETFGEAYERYRSKVKALIPFLF